MRIPGLTNQKMENSVASRVSRNTCRVHSQIWFQVYTQVRNTFIAVSEMKVQLARYGNDLHSCWLGPR